MNPLDDLNEAQNARSQKYAHSATNIRDHLDETHRWRLRNVRVLEIVEIDLKHWNPLPHHLIRHILLRYIAKNCRRPITKTTTKTVHIKFHIYFVICPRRIVRIEYGQIVRGHFALERTQLTTFCVVSLLWNIIGIYIISLNLIKTSYKWTFFMYIYNILELSGAVAHGCEWFCIRGSLKS